MEDVKALYDYVIDVINGNGKRFKPVTLSDIYKIVLRNNELALRNKEHLKRIDKRLAKKE